MVRRAEGGETEREGGREDEQCYKRKKGLTN
jgi:hypothetical protein